MRIMVESRLASKETMQLPLNDWVMPALGFTCTAVYVRAAFKPDSKPKRQRYLYTAAVFFLIGVHHVIEKLTNSRELSWFLLGLCFGFFIVIYVDWLKEKWTGARL